MVKRIAKEVQIFHHLHQRRIEEETPKENDYRKKNPNLVYVIKKN